MTISKEEITKQAKILAEKIREYSRSQKELWQQIPWLALEADGRSGHSDSYRTAYCSGFWRVEASISNGHYDVFVDLETGELLNAFHASAYFSVCDTDIPKESKRVLVSDEAVLKIAISLDDIDASKIIQELKECAKKPYAEYYSKEEKEAWRRKQREILDLKEVYVRKK